MAEGILEGVLGGEGSEAEEALPRNELDPAAAATATELAKFDPVLAAKTGAYFDQQREFVKIQAEHLHEQREITLACLKLRRRSEVLKVTLQTAVVLAAAFIVALVGMTA